MSKNLIPVTYNNERILTTKQLAEIYETTEGNISNNFNNNKERFQEKKHFYFLKGEELKQFLQSYEIGVQNSSKVRSLYLWTKRGASRHCKILDTDMAWEQFDNLEENYFNPKQERVKLSKELQAIFVLDERTQKIETKVNTLEDNVKDIKENSPLYNVECDELQGVVRKVGIKALGGYGTPAYKNNSLRQKVYRDIQNQLRREFGVKKYKAIKRCQLATAKEIVENYKIPTVFQDEVVLANNQVKFNLLLCKILPSSIGGRWIALVGRQHITYYTFLVLIQLLHQVALTAVF